MRMVNFAFHGFNWEHDAYETEVKYMNHLEGLSWEKGNLDEIHSIRDEAKSNLNGTGN
jgi:hypothetical protein